MGGNTYIQNIETVNGSASQQNSGVINTYNTTNDTGSMLELIDKLLASLPEIQGVTASFIEKSPANFLIPTRAFPIRFFFGLSVFNCS